MQAIRQDYALNPSWIVVAAGVSAALHVGKLPPAVTVLQRELGMSLVQAGFLLSVVQMAGMVLGLAVGLGVDRWGLRRSMLGGLLLMAFASMSGAFVRGLPWLMALRALEGLGLLLTTMPGPGLMRRVVPPTELSARMGWWGTYMPLGSALGLLLGPWVLAAASWQLWWMLLGATSLLAAAAVWRFLPADIAMPSPNQPHAQRLTHAGWWPRLAITLRNPGPWLIALSFMAYSAQWFAVIGFLPAIYAQAGVSGKIAGTLTALVAAANMAGNIASGKLLQKGWRVRRNLQTGFTAMGLCAFVAYVQLHGQPLAPLWLRFVAVVAFSAVGGLIPGSLFASAIRLAPSQETVSTTVGFMQQWSCVGQFFGPPVVAAVATLMGGWQWTWAVTASLCALGWLLALSVQRQWSKQSTHSG